MSAFDRAAAAVDGFDAAARDLRALVATTRPEALDPTLLAQATAVLGAAAGAMGDYLRAREGEPAMTTGGEPSGKEVAGFAAATAVLVVLTALAIRSMLAG